MNLWSTSSLPERLAGGRDDAFKQRHLSACEHAQAGCRCTPKLTDAIYKLTPERAFWYGYAVRASVT